VSPRAASTSVAVPTLTMFGRSGCHLCDEARAQLSELRLEGLAFELVEVDIEGDPGLHHELLELIPVLELEGERISVLGLDANALRRRLATVDG